MSLCGTSAMRSKINGCCGPGERGGRRDTLGGLGCFAMRVPLATVGHHGDSCAQERPIRARQ